MAPSNTTRLRDIGTLVLVGHGKMGQAMLEGWLEQGLDPSQVIVFDPAIVGKVGTAARQVLNINPDKPGRADTVVFAIKPQVAKNVLQSMSKVVDKNTLVLSIMAGKSLSFLADNLTPDCAIVRAMPNTPASIGRGITVAVPNEAVTAQQKARADALLAASGAVEWISDEALMDAVTAVSGSGPAYIFLLAETLTKAGIAAGLPAQLAAKLARDTVSGSGELLHRSPLEPSTLRENVTSPGGTTAAALEVLMAADGLDPLMRKAVAAATRRSRELAG
jgi:pyrroline-5-carboxylate reductase